MSKNMKIGSFDGPPCPRCGCPTEIREHERITEKELAKPFYYSRWYYCQNRDCKTTTIMPDEFKVRNENGAQRLDDVVTTPTEYGDRDQSARYIPPDNSQSLPIEPNAVFVKQGFKASLCPECGTIDLILANEDHKSCTLCGAEPSLT
jgi:hypothetical protein